MQVDNKLEKVAVFIRAHLDSPYLSASLNSINNQDYLGPIEIFIITDRVTPDVRLLIKNFTSKYNIKVIDNISGNLASGLNMALAETDSDYIAILDSDDLMHQSRIRKQVDFLIKHNFSALGSNLELIDEKGNELGISHMPQGNDVISQLPQISTIAHPSSIIKKDSLLSVGGYREFFAYSEDYDLWIRLSEKYSIGNMNEALTQYRIHPNQLTISKLKKHIWAVLATKYSKELRESGKIDLPNSFKDLEQWKRNGKRKLLRYKRFRSLLAKAYVSKNNSNLSFLKIYYVINVLIFNPKFFIVILHRKLKI